MKVADDTMRDIIFLDKHPGWSYADLLATPDDIVAGLLLLESKRA